MRGRRVSRSCRALLALTLINAFAAVAHAEKRALLIGISDYLPPAGATLPVPSGHALDSRFAPNTTWNSLHAPAGDVASMVVLLRENYAFKNENITVLPESSATREGILSAIDKLVAETKPGDFVVFYYSGHGSQRRDTLSSKNQLDETIVPIDTWKGDLDVRDKEMAVRFNRIVYDKHAHLTAIYDSCNSGTQARGIGEFVKRSLPYDDRDVAKDKAAHPNDVVVESDLKHLPQDGNATILAAADAYGAAVEARYPDDGRWHGAFTRALIRALQSSSQTMSAEDVVASVSSLLHADPVDFQQPSVEGRREQSLFGDPVAPHPLHVDVIAIPDPAKPGSALKLNVGSAGGFEPGTQFTAIDPGPGGARSVLEITSLDEPLVSTARLLSGPTNTKVGQVFELSKKVYPRSSQLAIFVSTPQQDSAATVPEQVKSSFPGLHWVADPSLSSIDYLVVEEDTGWLAYDYHGTALPPGPAAKGTAYMVHGPPQLLIDQLQLHAPFRNGAFTFTHTLTSANYLLAARTGTGGLPEVALFDPIVLAPRKPDAFVRSPGSDTDDAELNGGKSPEVVCRNDISLPVRTAWLHDKPGVPDGTGLSLALTRRIVRIGKLRAWLTSAALAPAMKDWPYKLEITQAGTDTPVPKTPMRPPHKYDVRLIASPDLLAAHPPSPKYVYLFGFDCSANSEVIFPKHAKTGVSETPESHDGRFPTSQLLYEPEDPGISNPFGADTVFFMATPNELADPDLLIADGELGRATQRGAFQDMNDFLSTLAKTATRDADQEDWTVQEIVIPSRP
jgi:hypothetical protein